MLSEDTVKQQLEVIKGFKHIASAKRTPEFTDLRKRIIDVNPSALKKNLNRILYPFGLAVIRRINVE